MPAAALDPDDLRHLRRLRAALRRARRRGRGIAERDLADLPRLYRHACSVLARLEGAGRDEDPRLRGEVARLVADAHGLLHAEEARGPVAATRAGLRLLLVDAPRQVRAEWRLLAATFALVYGLAVLAYVAVARDLDLAPSLLDLPVVEAEVRQLEATEEGEPFRGNFTFGLGESPQAAGWILVHNIGVSILFFAAALVPPLYLLLLTKNALMLGTYTGVAAHWGQAGAISSILWCHGVLEIQALVLAGTAGLCLVRAWVRPGPRTRRRALAEESRRAWRLFAPVAPLLVVAGLIEGFVSPHAPAPVRIATAVGTGLALLAWALLGGRGRAADATPTRPA